ncbi:uncharacterized protein EI90DRAFT_1917519 [Cantharellus anzutake]|uniref:uncharacterized protein n=1 Tax=Cantharellus anzutake TaxID=1750568 RepID=UPI0019042A97|nr:uncharacterized protein EI90DRAFT_1917519 [Cantharellus anzutake]KAF8326641.1 hypothetical protein EI90DRAFT_1917519 [Cantharellus anzutake]
MYIKHILICVLFFFPFVPTLSYRAYCSDIWMSSRSETDPEILSKGSWSSHYGPNMCDANDVLAEETQRPGCDQSVSTIITANIKLQSG